MSESSVIWSGLPRRAIQNIDVIEPYSRLRRELGRRTDYPGLKHILSYLVVCLPGLAAGGAEVERPGADVSAGARHLYGDQEVFAVVQKPLLLAVQRGGHASCRTAPIPDR
eukprot:1195513-Prorocentrum_minimum.AAC.2